LTPFDGGVWGLDTGVVMRVLCLGMDGADFGLVSRLLSEGRLPTLARLAGDGAFGRLQSTIPAFTPTAWSSFLTGLGPGGHGIFSFSAGADPMSTRVESAATRGGIPIWRFLGSAGVRSAFVTVPFTYPPEAIDGIMVTGFGGPQWPAIVPARVGTVIRRAYPGLTTAPRPVGWWEDFAAFERMLVEHLEQIADVCLMVLELEPLLGLLCVDFMSTDTAGHLAWHRLDVDHPAYTEAGGELVRVYEAADRVCGELIDHAAWLWGEEPTVVVMSDHGMRPTHWLFNANRWLADAGYLRYRRRSLRGLHGGRGERLRRVDEHLAARNGHYTRVFDRLPQAVVPAEPADVPIDRSSTSAFCYGYGGQVFLKTGDVGLSTELSAAFRDVRHPATGAPAFDVLLKEELFRGPYVSKAPDLVLLPRDDRVCVESARLPSMPPFRRHDRVDWSSPAGFTGHHCGTGIIAATGPGIRPCELPDDIEITQLAATLLALFGVDAGLEGRAIETLLQNLEIRQSVNAGRQAAPASTPYTAEDEAAIEQRLRSLGYE
jgi:predicted AlkP superfamily phosphohydrolase/phosphomutase